MMGEVLGFQHMRLGELSSICGSPFPSFPSGIILSPKHYLLEMKGWISSQTTTQAVITKAFFSRPVASE